MTITLSGIPITLQNAQVAARYVGNPATSMANGLLRGFISEAQANATIIPDDGTISAWVEGALEAIEHPHSAPELPIDVRGTAFQEAVWRELRRIPLGETRSYADIAKAVGQPDAVRAVGTANGSNPVAVLVPCHRVIRSDGSLGGYAGGLDRKRKLLSAEGADPLLI